MMKHFHQFAEAVSNVVGSPWAFVTALSLTLIWAACGPFFSFSDTWQLLINTGTTISTGLIVFVIQGAQNRHERAIQAKLDELIRTSNARNELMGIEHEDE